MDVLEDEFDDDIRGPVRTIEDDQIEDPEIEEEFNEIMGEADPQEAQSIEQSNTDLSTYDTVVVDNPSEFYIWGTNVSAQATVLEFKNFLQNFQKENSLQRFYIEKFKEMREIESVTLNLDCTHLKSFSDILYRHLIEHPTEVIVCFDAGATDVYYELFPEDASSNFTIQTRPYNLEEKTSMRDLDPINIDTLIMVEGMIIRASQVIPDLRAALFRCNICMFEERIDVNEGALQEPTSCKNCRARSCVNLIHNRCLFVDKQYIKLQESVESIPEGETPQTVTLRVSEGLVDVAKPGDKIWVTGIYRAHPLRPSRSRRNVQQIYKTFIDVLHFRKTAAGRLGQSNDDGYINKASDFYASYQDTDSITQEEEKKNEEIRRLSRDPNIYEKLVRSFAPSIWALEDLKKGVLCQLFGGSKKTVTDLSAGRFRSEINTLLVGDPGTSKSQLLRYVNKLAQRGIYTSGKGSSAVGLTAYVTKDPDTGEAVLESGALVLSDQGVCCIDEFDKMSDQTRSVLHEVMEQQTVSVAKAVSSWRVLLTEVGHRFWHQRILYKANITQTCLLLIISNYHLHYYHVLILSI
eukprot:TRINITY_DN6683_c0_g1_i1.p1 TRINITY_DN6683_c0_g1~~TRINITY_DN6683_c0_g1_i1.p1  ORF type:complete len:578 (-),score=69.28 TRINITY_DN6683_c0_g1_i1:510-2243(-)